MLKNTDIPLANLRYSEITRITLETNFESVGRRLSVSEIPLLFKRGSNPAPGTRDDTSKFENTLVCLGRTTIVKKVEEEQLSLTFFIF